MTETNNITPESMKNQALLERIAALTADYENQVADLRVAYTIASQEKENLEARLQEYEAPESDSE